MRPGRMPSLIDWLDFYVTELSGWPRRRRAAREARRAAGRRRPVDEPPTMPIPPVQWRVTP